MKNGRTIITLGAAALAVGGLGTSLGLTLPANAATTEAAATAKPLTYVVLNCNFKPVVEPSSYVLTCADDGTGLTDVHWTSWTSHLASAYGTFYENTCTPNCAEGKINHYRALVTLYDLAAVKGYPSDRRYVEMTVIFPSTRPPVYVQENGKGVKTFPLTQTFQI
jgi:hypothetical protein